MPRKPKAAPTPLVTRGFDLATIGPLPETIAFDAVDGDTGASLDLRITLAARYSAASRIAQDKAIAYVRANPVPGDADFPARVYVAHLVLEWDLLEDGKLLPVTAANALRLFALRGDVLEQAIARYEGPLRTVRVA